MRISQHTLVASSAFITDQRLHHSQGSLVSLTSLQSRHGQRTDIESADTAYSLPSLMSTAAASKTLQRLQCRQSCLGTSTLPEVEGCSLSLSSITKLLE